jgi:hypothetical protein
MPWILWIIIATGVYALVWWGTKFNGGTWEFWLTVGGVAVFVASIFAVRRLKRPIDDEAQARQRVRVAEDKLSDALRAGQAVAVPGTVKTGDAPGVGYDEISAALTEIDRHVDNLGATMDRIIADAKRQNERLTLAALWDLTHRKLDLYHTIVTGQAKRSFGAAQVAMAIGFILLVVFAVLAAEAKTTTAAISAGGLGAVGAAFAAYIGKTFIRSQESAATHLRAYFDQPLELSRYLAAERLLADAADLTAEQRAAIITSLVEAIATAGQDDKAKDDKPRGRQSRSRAPR